MAQATPQDGANPGSEEDANGNDEGLIMNFDGIIKVYLRYPQPVEEPWAPNWIANEPARPDGIYTTVASLSAHIEQLREEAHEYFTETQEYIEYLLNKDTPIGVTVVTPLGRIEYDLEQWEVIYQMIQATRFKAAEQHAELNSMNAAEMAFLQKDLEIEIDKHRNEYPDDDDDDDKWTLTYKGKWGRAWHGTP